MEEETLDPEWNRENHPALEVLERYPDEFRDWVRHLGDLALLLDAGFPFSKDDLSLVEWRSLGVLMRWERSRPSTGSG